jgi:hypothetical protein
MEVDVFVAEINDGDFLLWREGLVLSEPPKEVGFADADVAEQH